MKINCHIADSSEIARIVASHLSKEMGKEITYKEDSCYLTRDGMFNFVYMDENGVFSKKRIFTANEIAHIINMPLWEIIGTDDLGYDDIAILFYKEN